MPCAGSAFDFVIAVGIAERSLRGGLDAGGGPGQREILVAEDGSVKLANRLLSLDGPSGGDNDGVIGEAIHPALNAPCGGVFRPLKVGIADLHLHAPGTVLPDLARRGGVVLCGEGYSPKASKGRQSSGRT